MKTYEEMLEVFGSAVDNARDKKPYVAIALTVASELGELYDEIERLRSLTTWQPITEAPDDEFVIVWCYGDYGIGRHSICCYDNTRRWLIDGQMAANPSDYHLHVEPTHWMPLPEPPKEDAS